MNSRWSMENAACGPLGKCPNTCIFSSILGDELLQSRGKYQSFSTPETCWDLLCKIWQAQQDTHCRGVSHWPFPWSLQLFSLFILPESTLWDQTSGLQVILRQWAGECCRHELELLWEAEHHLLTEEALFRAQASLLCWCSGRKIFIHLGYIMYSIIYAVENSWSILRQLAGKSPRV